jgi:protein phosphatase
MSAAELSSVRVDAWGQTDVGLRRENNEDHFVIMKLSRRADVLQTSVTEPVVFQELRRQEGWLFMVADGVGGHRGGELASQTAITSLARYLTRAAGCFNNADAEKENEVLEQLEAAVHDAHRRISEEYGSGSAGEPGPATTLTMAMLVWPRAYVVHVGDSRAFFLRNGRLRQLTKDQTTGEFMMAMGAWTEEQARKAPIAGALVSALGASSMTPSVGLVDLQQGDTLLLCSDGLTRCVSDERIAEMLDGAGSAEAACSALVEAALAGGGPDNVTVVTARMVAS